MINVDALLHDFFPDFKTRKKSIYKITSSFLKKMLHQEEINQFIESHQHLEGLEFLDAVLDHFDFKYSFSNRDRANIPAQGRVIIVANHPLGSLDGLSLLKMVSEIRPDVKIVATSLLSQLQPLNKLFLSVDNLTEKASQIKNLKQIVMELEQDKSIILFPSGEVSRFCLRGIRDGQWKTGFIRLASRTNSPVLPIFIKGKNSTLFYSMSTLYKPLGTLMLVKEMFNKHDQEIAFRVGKIIPMSSMQKLGIPPKLIAERMRKQVYQLARNNKKPLFDTIENIVHPASRKSIRNELKASELIRSTPEGMQIYLCDYQPNSSVIREIGRLRELSFRQVQDGTGHTIDIDQYDRYYRHLVLWDDNDLEIVGAYRIGEGARILAQRGVEGFYTHSLFKINAGMISYLEKSIELGRSFIQPRYWGRRSLDYLWFGIGAYLQRHPGIEYMFGPVSLTGSYSDEAKNVIVSFYRDLFGRSDKLVTPRLPYNVSQDDSFSAFKQIKKESEYKQAYALMKEKLDLLGVRVPTLFKQYVEVCRPGGCEFLGFNFDPEYSNCILAMILVHIDAIYPKKQDRYIHGHTKKQEQAA